MRRQGSLTVVIPTLNAENRIGKLLESLFAQDRKPDKVIVVDSASSDKTCDIVSSFDEIEVVSVARSDFNHGLTRHKAIQNDESDFVAFLTDDVEFYEKDTLSRMLNYFTDKNVAAVSVRQAPRSDARKFEKYVRNFNYPTSNNVRCGSDIRKLGIKAIFFSDVCAIYRRSAYDAVGGFSKVNTNEDMLIAAKFLSQGMKLAYLGDRAVMHSHNLSLLEQYRRNVAIGRFMYTHKEALGNLPYYGEGIKVSLYVNSKLLKDRAFKEIIAFNLDCLSRLTGNIVGKVLSGVTVCRKRHKS